MAICPHKARQRDLQSQHLPASLFPRNEGWEGGKMPEEFSVMDSNKDKVLVPVLLQNFQNKTAAAATEKGSTGIWAKS